MLVLFLQYNLLTKVCFTPGPHHVFYYYFDNKDLDTSAIIYFVGAVNTICQEVLIMLTDRWLTASSEQAWKFVKLYVPLPSQLDQVAACLDAF